MLRLLQKQDDAFINFCTHDVFGTRISAYFMTYGTGFSFASFYLQESGNQITAAVCRIDGNMTICCKKNADIEELNEFIDIVGYSSLMCDADICGGLNLKSQKTGYIVEFKESKKTSENKEICFSNGFELSDIYDILNRSGFDGLPEKLQWLQDVSTRLKKSTAYAEAINENGKPAACAMVLFETEKAALIGAVATVPECRGKGYAGALVSALAGEMAEKKKRAELLCANNSIYDFYSRLGFVKTGEWALV